MAILLLLLTGFFAGASAQSAETSAQNAAAPKPTAPAMQRLEAGPLSIVSYGLQVRGGSRDTTAYTFIRFYNNSDSLLLEYIIHLSLKPGGDYISAGDYTETPPGTRYLTVGIGKSSGEGSIYADDLTVDQNVGTPVRPHVPQISEDQYLKPFWHSDTILNETVLLLAKGGLPAQGQLLYTPDKILRVRSFGLDTTYVQGKDYTLAGRTLIRTTGSRMPYRADTSFDPHDLAWFNLQSQWVVVTYTHKDKWDGPVPPYKGNRLPRLMAKLKAHAPVTIVAYGMSITRGLDVSGYDGVPPYTPNYMDLLAHGLRKRYGYPERTADQARGRFSTDRAGARFSADRAGARLSSTGITLYNAGLPGSLVSWGAEYAGQYVNPLKPDLVVVDFGMNDFWRYTPQEFRGYIQTILRKVRAANPHAEFMLVSNMKFDPAYILDSDRNKAFYVGNMQGYHAVLQELQTTGVIEVDMNTLSDFLYRRKKAKDCIANPLHPNDYLSRWYAQAMLAALDAP